MRSRAHIKSHPIHPILVAFPIAFLTGALVFDAIAVMSEATEYSETAFQLLVAGIVAGLVAGVPGLIDYLYTVPPASSAKKRASIHALLNLCVLALFGIALLHRTGTNPMPGLYVSLEAVGFVLMLVAGWMGGTLVHRNQIGVDPRYAFAGKWRELHLSADNGRLNLGDVSDLKRDQMLLVHVDGKRIVVGRTEGGFVAFEDRCTHRGGSLAAGVLICGTVQCPWHGSQFDATTGAVKAGPAKEKIFAYKVETADNNLYLNLHPEKL